VALRPRLSPGVPLSRDGWSEIRCGTEVVKGGRQPVAPVSHQRRRFVHRHRSHRRRGVRLTVTLPFFIPPHATVAGVKSSVVFGAVAGMEVGAAGQPGAASELIVGHGEGYGERKYHV
jgi:hypothetical protein